MTVNVPADNAERVGLRKVIDEEAVKKVVKYLTSGGTEMPKNWNRRFKHNRDKMKTGDIFELAEVVRNLSLRDGEKGLSTGEKQMYVKAKKILASELMYAKNLSEDDAIAWLEGVLTGPEFAGEARGARSERLPLRQRRKRRLPHRKRRRPRRCRWRLGRARRRGAGRAARGRPSEGVCAARRSSAARRVAAAPRRIATGSTGSCSSPLRMGGAGDPPRRGDRRLEGRRLRHGRRDALGVRARRARRGAGRRGRRPRPRRRPADAAAGGRPAAARSARARASTAPSRASLSRTPSSGSATASSSRRLRAPSSWRCRRRRRSLPPCFAPRPRERAPIARPSSRRAAGASPSCAGDERLLKVTTADDLRRVEAMLAAEQ